MSLVPKGPLATPLLVMMANLAGFSRRMRVLHRRLLVEMFVPGLLVKFPAGPKAADPDAHRQRGADDAHEHLHRLRRVVRGAGSADTNYRLLRAWVYGMFFYMGKFADEAVTASCTGWPAPARLPSFVTCFGSLFFAATSLGNYPVAVAKKPKTA